MRRADPGVAALKSLDLEAHLGDPSRKQAYVTSMFTVIAPRYDDFTRCFSYGLDRGWKAHLVSALASRLPARALVADLACGTGDLAFQLSRLLPQATIQGCDVTPQMVIQAQASARATGRTPTFVVGDMMHLPYADGSLDGLIIGYGVRNVPQPQSALDECARVLRPGGMLGCLDFFRPQSAWWRALFLGYLSLMGSLYGWWWHGHADVYRYIARSIDHFVSLRDWRALLASRGFVSCDERSYLGGGVATQIMRKGPAPTP